jgi:hypothetical protein
MWPSPAATASVASTHPKAQLSAAPTAVKYYIVPPARHGSVQTLSVIAARTLGSSELFMEIFNLNKGRLQPNGARLENPNTIDPGWILELPGIATGPGVHFGLLPGQRPRVVIVAPHKAVAAAAPYSAAGWVVPGAAIALVIAAAGLGVWLSRRRRPGRAESGRDRGIPAADTDDCDLAWLESLDEYPWASPRSGPALHPDHPSAPFPRIRDQDEGWDPPARRPSRGWDSPATQARGWDRPVRRTSDGRDPLQWWPTPDSPAGASRRPRANGAPELTRRSRGSGGRAPQSMEPAPTAPTRPQPPHRPQPHHPQEITHPQPHHPQEITHPQPHHPQMHHPQEMIHPQAQAYPQDRTYPQDLAQPRAIAPPQAPAQPSMVDGPSILDLPEPPGTYATAQLETHHGHELRLAQYNPAASAGLYQQNAADIAEPDSRWLASRVLSEADQQAAAIRTAAQQKAARLRQLAIEDATAVREAADRDAAEMREAAMKMRTDLSDVAAYVRENLPVAAPGTLPD